MGRVVRVGGPGASCPTLPWFHRTKTFMVWRVDSLDATEESRAVLSEGVKTAMVRIGRKSVYAVEEGGRVRSARSSSSSRFEKKDSKEEQTTRPIQ
jgi:hypothetical protein